MLKKKKYLLVSAFIYVVMPQIVNAQSVRNEVQILEGSYGIEKKQIISQVLNLSEKKQTIFG